MEAFFRLYEFFSFLFSGIPMTIILVVVGIYIAIKIGFIQLRWAKKIIRSITAKGESTKKKGAISPMQALSTALAGTVGTGNIAGVAGAISLGGPGAIFWMWVAAVIGMGTKYAEIVLAVYYREKNIKGEWVGGPMYYIKNGLNHRLYPLATAFSLFGCLAALGIGNMTQANTVARSILSIATLSINETVLKLLCGIVMASAIAFVILGGIMRVGETTAKIVPAMSLLYIVGTLVILIANIEKIIPVLEMIVFSAFNPDAVLGGGSGIALTYALRHGVGRGVFSNEAGLGSAPIAYASADIDSPVKQGFYGIAEVFIDTIIMCSLTAFAILVTETEIPYGKDVGIELTINAFTEFYGDFAAVILAVAVSLFAFSSIISWSIYGIRCFEALFGSRYIKYYKLLFILTIIPATMLNIELVWDIAELLNGMMALPNIIALFMLTDRVVKLTKDYALNLR